MAFIHDLEEAADICQLETRPKALKDGNLAKKVWLSSTTHSRLSSVLASLEKHPRPWQMLSNVAELLLTAMSTRWQDRTQVTVICLRRIFTKLLLTLLSANWRRVASSQS